MTQYSATVRASKTGSIGTKYCEVRQYKVEAVDRFDAVSETIRLAYLDGLEHVLITKLTEEESILKNNAACLTYGHKWSATEDGSDHCLYCGEEWRPRHQ
jgi:hypothetical protein